MKRITLQTLLSLSIVLLSGESYSSTQVNLNWGVSERQGERGEMEDAHVAILNFNNKPDEAFFGIFDGHAGDQSARAAAQGIPTSNGKGVALHDLIAQSQQKDAARYIQAYQKMDEIIRSHYPKSGATAVTVHIAQGAAFIAWVGDARAVLVRQDGTISEGGTTIDHKPDSPGEHQRIKDTGESIYPHGVWRVGGLAISRALGDDDIKQNTKSIIATPDVKRINLQPRHHLLILACDGVWDVLSNERAAQIVQRALKQTEPLPNDPILARKNSRGCREITTQDGNNVEAIKAARALRDAAHSAGSTDNISVLIVEFLRKTQLEPSLVQKQIQTLGKQPLAQPTQEQINTAIDHQTTREQLDHLINIMSLHKPLAEKINNLTLWRDKIDNTITKQDLDDLIDDLLLLRQQYGNELINHFGESKTFNEIIEVVIMYVIKSHNNCKTKNKLLSFLAQLPKLFI